MLISPFLIFQKQPLSSLSTEMCKILYVYMCVFISVAINILLLLLLFYFLCLDNTHNLISEDENLVLFSFSHSTMPMHTFILLIPNKSGKN